MSVQLFTFYYHYLDVVGARRSTDFLLSLSEYWLYFNYAAQVLTQDNSARPQNLKLISNQFFNRWVLKFEIKIFNTVNTDNMYLKLYTLINTAK